MTGGKQKQPTVSTDMSDTLVTAYADDLLELDQQITDLQGAKKRVYETIREDHGKKAAKALKIAVTVHAMDSEKRNQADEIDAEAQRLLAIIAAPRAPRATRESAKGVPDHDPVTGEIIEPDSNYPEIPDSSTEPASVPPTSAAVVEAQPLDTAEEATDPASSATIKPEAANQSLGDGDTAIRTGNAVDGAVNGTVLLPTPQGAADGTAHRSVVTAGETAPSNVVTLKSYANDPPHPDCLKPSLCKGYSNIKLCQPCIDAAAGFVQVPHEGSING